MVSESEVGNVMSVCLDFTQNAWKKDLCVNCQRPKAEHATADKSLEAGAKSLQTSGTDLGSDSPKPAKRNSLMTKSWTPIPCDLDTQKTEGCNDDEEDKWNSMCLPDPNTGSQQLDITDKKLAKVSSTVVEKLSSEHSKSVAGDDIKSGHSLDGAGVDFKTNYICHGAGSAEKSVICETNAKTVVKKTQNPEDRLITAIHPDNEVMCSKDRTRSLSREQSPMLAPKPKLSDKPAVVNRSVANEPNQKSSSVKHKVKKNIKDEHVKDSENNSVKDKESDGSKNKGKKEVDTDLSPRHHKKCKNKKSISFVDDEPVVIGDDGGLDNLYSDHEDDVKENETGTKELLHFTEDEKDWALQALKNTVWNTEHVGVCKDSEKKNAYCKEFEDLKVGSLSKSDILTNAMESDPAHVHHSFGTFPLRSKSEKTVMDNIFSGNRLSTLTESSENLDETTENKYDAVLRFLGADKFDFASSPKHKNAMKSSLNVSDGSVESDPSYDDPWCDKFAFESESEMNLLDEIKGEIDLDSSTAGFALVDLLNDVLAKYSVGSPSEKDSLKNVDSLNDDIVGKDTQSSETDEISKVKSAQFEAKMVTIAANLRKQQAKGRAPRPPSCPPEPPQESVVVSPAKQLDLRAAQSKEPTFSMVPVGKPIGANLLMQAVEAQTKMDLASANAKHDLGSTSSCNSLENVNINKVKLERDKQKKTGGFGSFFSRLFSRGSQSETDITVSSETLNLNSGSHSDVQCDTANQSENEDNLEKLGSAKGDNSKDIKIPTKSSPPMKLIVLPVHPVSPRPTEKPPLPVLKKEDETEVIKTKENSPELEVRCRENINNEINSSQKIADTDEAQIKSQISPAKSKESLISSPKLKEAPPLPVHPPRDSAVFEQALGPPKPHDQGNMDSGTLRSRPRKKDSDTLVKPGVPPPKPPVAIKPRPPVLPVTQALDNTINAKLINIVPRDKEVLTCTHSLNEKQAETKVLKKRAKSPKRVVAPLAPSRVSMPNILTDSNISLASNVSEDSIQSMPSIQTIDIFSKSEVKGSAFAKELEMKFSKDKDHHQTIATETRKLGAPPNPPSSNAKMEITEKEKSKSLPAESKKPLTLIKDKEVSKTFPRESDKGKSFATDDTKFQISDEDKKQPTDDETVTQSKVQLEEVKIHSEKIELPKPAGNSRKSFLGKLNRKSKQAPTPSVKRTKSITESSIIADHHLKKIDVKDISGPVLITEMSCNKVVNRRNTISLGDDTGNSFLSGGSTSSGSTSAGDKSDLSSRGSLENMYEFIKTEAPMPPVGDKKHLYDPIIENNGVAVRPPSYTGSEGYLEPVRSNSGALQNEPVTSKMADSKSSMTNSMVAMVNNIAEMDQSVNGDFYMIDANIDQQDMDEMEISPERQALLASQPIYEEIPNGYGKLGGKFGDIFSPNVLNDGNVEEQIYGVNSYLHCESAAAQNARTLPANQIASSNLKSKDSFSSDSELSSASNSLSHPRPIPRRRPRQIGSGFEQYVAMNRPSVAVFLNEEQLREMLGKLTAMNLSTLRTIYTQHEKCFTKESLHLSSVGPLKWQDFDIYGKPVHTSEKCIVYNAKMRLTMSPCQLMLLHSRPVITSANHPSLLKPTCIFTDSVPYSYLTDEFIKTSQILETCVNQSNANVAECYIVVGLFDITESLTKHMNSLETVCENQDDFLRKVLFFVLQLLSAISHCLEQGHPLSEADFHDLYLISNPYCLGETISFLPQVRAPEDQQIDKVCLFLEKFLEDMCKKCEASSVLDDLAFFTYTGVQRVIELLESGVTECLPVVRSYTEFLLWGPADKEKDFQDDQQINLEPKLSMWLEKERAELIHDFAKGVHRCADCNIRDFYKMKFLLKSSSSSLLECLRCHSVTSS